ncbi:MAG: glycosyltransferase [Fibrobacterota bacterium]|nr:glycosyltransferase [Chitinispirillaceae bacterium]
MSLALSITFLFFSVVYITVILLLLRGLLSLRSYNEQKPYSYSIVIAARNEESNLRACLDNVLNQSIDRSRYEVIVVDDRSEDTTLDIALEYVDKYENMKVIHIEDVPEGLSPKKHAVSQGVKLADHEIVVFTDADCIVPREWLMSINKTFGETTGLVQGITKYSYVDGMSKTFWGLQAVDFISHGIVAAAAIGANVPINSNANNFAFRKDAFREIGGYGSDSGKVVSGDDDLLLQKIWKSRKWKIRFMIESTAAVTTIPTKTVKGVLEQRKRWGSKTVHYHPLQVALLSGIFLFYLCICGSLICGLFFPQCLLWTLGLIILKTVGEMVLMIPGTRIFHQVNLRKWILPASLLQLPLVLFAVFAGVFGKFKWKGQKFNRVIK